MLEERNLVAFEVVYTTRSYFWRTLIGCSSDVPRMFFVADVVKLNPSTTLFQSKNEETYIHSDN